MKTNNIIPQKSQVARIGLRLLASLIFLFSFLPETATAQNLQIADDLLGGGTIGGTKGYRIRRIGAGSPAYSREAAHVYYPASAIKMLQHFYAMKLVQDNIWDLNTTSVRTCMNTDTCGDYAFDDATCTMTLSANNQLMMVNSDNDKTNALQERIGKQINLVTPTPAALGRGTMNAWASGTLGWTAGAINTKFGCGGFCSNNNPNTLTLLDNERMYVKMAGNTILNNANRIALKDLALNESNNFFDNIIDEECADLNKDAIKASFKSKIRMVYKNGSYTCGGQSARTQGGLLQFPTYGGAYKRLFTYGVFIDDTESQFYLPGTIQAATRELIRPAVRGALLTWGGGYWGPGNIQGIANNLGQIMPLYQRTREYGKLVAAHNLLLSAKAQVQTTIPDYSEAVTDLSDAMDAILDFHSNHIDSVWLYTAGDIYQTMLRLTKDAHAYAFSTGDGTSFGTMMGRINQAMHDGEIICGPWCDSIPPKKEHLEEAALLADGVINWSLQEPSDWDLSVGFSSGTAAFKQAESPLAPSLEVTAWPNPVSELLNIEIQDEPGSEVIAELYDLQGRMLIRKELASCPTGRHEMQFDVRMLPAGPAVLKVRSATKNISKVLSITH